MQRPHISPFFGDKLNNPINSSNRILHNLLLFHRPSGNPHHTTSTRINKQQGRPTNPLNLFLPILPTQLNRNRDLLLLVKMLPNSLRKKWDNPLISKEQIIRITQLPLCLKGLVIRLQFGEFDDFSNWDFFIQHLLLRRFRIKMSVVKK
uniref:Uncharacterized protein n=1 Tax=Opuntia streptacantha TaxID=393608 RepID=A0A7C8YH31_OPUST